MTSATACPFHAMHGSAGALSPQDLQARAEAFDPFQQDYMVNPSEYVRWAREQAPVFYSPQLDYWVITRHATLKEVFRDPVTFSPSNVLEPMAAPDPEVQRILQQYDYGMSRTLVNEDEPMHMARRRVLMEPFTPEHLREHEARVRELVNEAIDSFVDAGEVDLVKALFWHVPFTVALQFLGIDDEADRKTMHQFAIAHTINAFGRPTPEQRHEIAHTVGRFWQFSGEVLEKMRQTPDGPGWMRYSLRQQREHPDVVTDSYLHSMMMAMIVAAHETTTFASTNAMKLLLEHPQTWREVCDDPSLISPAMEECLRHDGSIGSWRRRTTREVTLEGVEIPAGARLLLVVHSANHDPEVFGDPDTFDIRRDNSANHLTFGFGAHQCLGKNLGRMEMQIMIGELARRLPHMRLVPQDLEYVANLSFRGPQHLWVQWDPAMNPEREAGFDRTEPLPPTRLGAPLARDLGRPVRVVWARTVGEGLLHLRLEAANGQPLPSWEPGAHIDIECGSTAMSRQYSLCGDPEDRSGWEVTVLREPESRGGSAWLHEHVRAGTPLRVRGPRNHFALEPTAAPLLFVAGGIGVTPVLTLAEAARRAGMHYELHYCARRAEAMAFRDELAAIHGTAMHSYVSSRGERLDFASLLARQSDDVQVYACGPIRMIEGLTDSMRERGLPEDALHTEIFSAAGGAHGEADNRPFEVELTVSGLQLEVPADRSLLTVLRANNVDVPSDCEEGLCGACEVPVVEGEVDHRDIVLRPVERKQNRRMMSCCSRAAGARLKIGV